jgi:hypothetical protein
MIPAKNYWAKAQLIVAYSVTPDLSLGLNTKEKHRALAQEQNQ